MFHADRLGLQPFHLSKLIQGDTIRLKHAQLTGPVLVHLTKVQWNKLRKVRANGTGMTLKMSSAQVRHNIQHGEGLWDTITGIYNRVAPVVKAIIPVVKSGYDAYKFFKGGTIEDDLKAQYASGEPRPRSPVPIVAKSRAEHDVLSAYGVDVQPFEDTQPKVVKASNAIKDIMKQLPPTAAAQVSSTAMGNPAIGFQLTGTGIRRKRT